jgi:hypothetical protein
LNYCLKHLLLLYFKTSLSKYIEASYSIPFVKKSIIERVKNTYKKNKDNIDINKMNYDYVKNESINKISFLIQLIIVWTFLSKFSICEYVLFFILCLIIIILWLALPVFKATIPELKNILTE